MKRTLTSALMILAISSASSCSKTIERSTSSPIPSAASKPVSNANLEEGGQSKDSVGSLPQKESAEAQQAGNSGPTVVPGSVRVTQVRYLDRIENPSGVMETKPGSGKTFAWIVLRVANQLKGFGSTPITAVSEQGVEYPLVGFGFNERKPGIVFGAGLTLDHAPKAVTLTFMIDAGARITKVRGIGAPIDVPSGGSKR